jgi:Ca2+-binding EF-hand superfamily protein
MRQRSTVVIVAIVLIFGLFGGLTLAQTPMQAQPDWKARFAYFDRNKDGRIDRAEFQEWMTDVFYLRDKDHKGYLVFEDVRGIMTPETLKAINLKGDGRLTLQEFLNATFQDFAAADVNHNGSLTVEEIDVYIKKAGN